MCVSVCVWIIWIEVKPLPVLKPNFQTFQFNSFISISRRGQERHGKSPANEDTYHRRWYQTWPVWRTCTVVITCCSGSAFIELLCNHCMWMASGQAKNRQVGFHWCASVQHSGLSAATMAFLHRWPVLICMRNTFHFNHSKSCSEQVCGSCRFDKMTWALRGIPF